MAALGTIPSLTPSVPPLNPPLYNVSAYRVQRGRYLGAVTVTINAAPTNPPLYRPVLDYIVRQTRILYRQIWPGKGQRFPQ